MVMEKTGRVMAAHQPNFLPYLGFLDKMMQSEVFVIRDECHFSEKEYHHRNKIRIDGKRKKGKDIGGPNWKWLTVPIPRHEIDLKDIPIKNEVMDNSNNNRPWNVEMARQIKINYRKAPFFEQYFPRLEKTLLTRREMLVDLSMDVIYFLKEAFGLQAEIVYASKLPGYKKSGNPVQDLVNLTKIVGADVYLSGAGGKDSYLSNPEPFTREGIEVRFQDYQHPVYPQRYWGFAPYMAAIDALFNAGPSILKAGSKKEDIKEESKKELQMQQS